MIKPIFITDFYRSQNPVVTQADSAATFSRAGSAYRQYPYGDKFYISEISSDVLRCSWRQGKNGLWIRGAHLEGVGQNRVTYPCEIDDASWLKGSVTVVDTPIELPDRSTSDYDVLYENNVFSVHRIYKQMNIYSGGTASFGVWLRPILRDKVQLFYGSFYAIFDLGIKAVIDSNEIYYVEIDKWGDWYRVWINFLAAASTWSWASLYLLDDDFNQSYTGLGQDVMGVWGFSLEQVQPFASSYMENRAADSDWQAAIALNDSREGWCSTAIWIPAHTPIAEIPVMTISNNGSATNYIKLVINISRQLELRSTADGGDSGLCLGGIVADGNVYQIYFTWKNNNLSLCLNSIWATTDSSVTIPDLNQINLHPFGGIIGDIQIGDVYNRIPWRIPAAL